MNSKIEIRVINNRIYVRAPYQIKDQLKEIESARWKANIKLWSFAATPIVALKIDSVLPAGYQCDDGFRKLLEQAYKMGESQAMKDADDLPPIPCTRFPAWRHQLQAYWFAHDLPAAMLYMFMGTGKTKVAVDLIINRKHKLVLIACPKSVVSVWPKEFKKHAGNDMYEVLPLSSNDIKKRTEAAKTFVRLQHTLGKQAIIVANYEMIWREPFASWLMTAGVDLVVCDESHRIKAPGSKVSAFLAKLADRVPYRLCLTGTPMPHSPLDVYGQYRFLDKGIFGTSFTKFRARYAVTVPLGDTGALKITGYQNQDELQEKFYSIAYRADQDVLDLPEAVHMTRDVELSAKTMRIYRDLEKDFYAQIDSGEVTISNALTKLLRLQQVCSGYVPSDDGQILHVGDEKADVLADTLGDIDINEPVVVFCRFRQDLDRVREVCEKLGRSYAELSGRCNQLAEWQAGKYNTIAVQIQAGGVGVDLTRACYNIYYSVGCSLGDYEQSLARSHRPGQTRTTFFIHIVATDTVDEKIYRSLEQKKEVVQAILDREV